MKIVLEQDELDYIEYATDANSGIDAKELQDRYEKTMASNFEQDIDDLANEMHGELEGRLNELREKERVCSLDKDEIYELCELEAKL